VRTTLTLENDVAARLRAEARRTGRSFKDVVNECLRYGLARPEPAPTVSHFRVRPRDLGALQPGVSPDNVAELLERVEGPDRR
jgi:plasmid stability protein